MTYIVTKQRIACKYMECVEVCPMDCSYDDENMLVIHPGLCIDCGVCEPERPVLNFPSHIVVYRRLLGNTHRAKAIMMHAPGS